MKQYDSGMMGHATATQFLKKIKDQSEITDMFKT